MALVYPLPLPSTRIRKASLTPVAAVAVGRSPFTFATQTQVNPGQAWALSLTLPPMKRHEAQVWLGFLAGLNGREGTFLGGDPLFRHPFGVATGVPVVDGAGQTGRVLATRGWTAGLAGILKAGDFIQLGSGATARLHTLSADAASDGFGKAALDIWPGLRAAPADGAAVVVTDARGVFRLATNAPSIDRDLIHYGLTIEAEEVL